jgi:hypothetical protein
MSEAIERRSQFSDTPQGWAERWQVEIAAARKEVETWHTQATKAIAQYLDEKRDAEYQEGGRLNLYHSNITTLQALLYGKTPSVDVGRRFADSDDDQARVAAEMIERMLNTDIERDSDSYADAMELALLDRLLAGLGVMRMRYVAEFETQEVPAQVGTQPDPVTGQPVEIELAPAYSQEVKTFEDVETDYVHWRDFLWSPARVWKEVRWIGFRSFMPYESLVDRFGQKIADEVPLKSKKRGDDEEGTGLEADPWSRAEVWEIWSKEDKKVYWWVDGCDVILDVKDDLLGLDGFWPCPRPMMANVATSKFVPKPDFEIAKKLYYQIDTLFVRIGLLEKSIRVSGVYDKANPDVGRLISIAAENELVPVDNWAMFAEKGGLKGSVDWFPIETITLVLDKLTSQLNQKIQLLYQISGMSDIMRGATNPTETLGAQQLKAKFASVRVQRLQDDVARCASDAQRIRAEIISKHFDPETIMTRSNVQYTDDRDLAQQAVQLIKDRFHAYRITVKPEAVAMTDFAALKQERTEFLAALSSFLPPMMAAAQQIQGSLPSLLKMLKWVMTGFRGASTIEGVLDQAIAAAEKSAQQPTPPKPNPRIQVEQVRAKAGLEREKVKAQIDLLKIDKQTEGKVIEQGAQAIFSEGRERPVPPEVPI